MLVERDREVAELVDLIGAARAATGHLVFLGGEAGVGKSALMADVAGRAAEQVTVRRGTADSVTTAAPLGGLVDAMPELNELLDKGSGFSRLQLFRRIRTLLGAEPTLL